MYVSNGNMPANFSSDFKFTTKVLVCNKGISYF